MGLLQDFQLLTENSRVQDNSLYYKSDGIYFTYDRLDFAIESQHFSFTKMFDYAKKAVDNIEDSTEKMKEITNDIDKIKLAKVKQIQKLDTVFSALLKSELIDFDNKVGKYLEQYE